MALQLVDQDVGSRSIGPEDGAVLFYLNRIAIPVLRKMRASLNAIIKASRDGAFPIGDGYLTMGHGAPPATALPGLYVDLDGGFGTTLYVFEGGVWNPK